jgi:hypothetical protein
MYRTLPLTAVFGNIAKCRHNGLMPGASSGILVWNVDTLSYCSLSLVVFV